MQLEAVVINEVPNHLRDGDLYGVVSDVDGTFTVPTACYKKDLVITSNEDLLYTLRTVAYWMIKLPMEVIEFILDHDLPPRYLDDFRTEFPELFSMARLRTLSDEQRLGASLNIRDARLWEVVHQRGAEINNNTLHVVSSTGSADALAWVRSKGVDWRDSTLYSILCAGNVETLRYAVANNCPMTPGSASMCKSLECLRMIRGYEGVINEDTALYAAEINDVSILAFLVEDCGLEMFEDICEKAAEFGSFAALKYLHEEANAPWSTETPAAAAFEGHLECLKYAHEAGCPWDAETPANAAMCNHNVCLEYAHREGCAWDSNTTENAAAVGNISGLVYAHTNGCAWTEECARRAAIRNPACLAYALAFGCPVLSTAVCRTAAQYGNINCLQIARVIGNCPWDEATCAAAANGHLACLRWAHENGCPWDGQTLVASQEFERNQACYEYAVAQGCPEL